MALIDREIVRCLFSLVLGFCLDMNNRFTRLLRGVIATAGLCSVGCASNCGGSATRTDVVSGELGNGEFTYECLGRSDAACPPLSSDDRPPPFPDCLVRGGRFDLSYVLTDDSAIAQDGPTPTLGLSAASYDFFGNDRPFVARRAGRAAVLVENGEYVVDLLHLDILEPTGMDLVTGTGQTVDDRVVLEQGEQLSIVVLPQAELCFVAGGSLPLRVRSDGGAAQRSVVRVDVSDVLQLQGSAVGTTSIEIELGDMSRILDVEVVPGGGGQETDTGAGAETDSGTGTGTDTDTDTDTDADTDTDTDTDADTDADTDTDTDTDTGGGG